MDWIQAFILGIVQGLTEFLPISSSGHLVLAQYFLGIETPGVLLEVILHMGTLVAILIYFYDDIKLLLKKGFWINCHPLKKEWSMVIYERKTTGWIKRKRKLFTHPVAAYDWAINYLEPLINYEPRVQ